MKLNKEIEFELKTLKNIVEDYFGVSILEKTRKRYYTDAKMIFRYLAKKYTKANLTQIGKFSKCDHASVIHAIKKVKNYNDYDIEFRNKYNNFLDTKLIEIEHIRLKSRNEHANYLVSQLTELTNAFTVKLTDESFYNLINIVEKQTNNLKIAV